MHHLASRAAWGVSLCMTIGTATAGASGTVAGNATVTPQLGGQALHVSGVIGPEFEPDIRRALRRHPEVRHVVVESPGGLRAQAMRAGQLLNRRGITVRVDGRCASACALLWATASSREMTAGSRIGLHRSSLDRDLPIPAAMREQLMRHNDRGTDATLLRAGFPAHVVERGASTPPGTMAWFRADELAGVRFALLAPPSPGHAGPDRLAADTGAVPIGITAGPDTPEAGRHGR